ncbi:MAG: ATPase, partial [Nitrospiraceae bacterium]
RNGRLYNMFDRERLSPLFQAISHCNNAKRIRRPHGRMEFSGDPTEVALIEFAEEQGMTHRQRVSRMGELPFDTDRKRMSTIHWMEGKLVAFVKGAPELMLPLCSRIRLQGNVVPMREDERGTILDQSRLFARQAYRVLAVATRTIEAGTAQHLTPETVERDLTFLGLVALMDPPHREVPEAIARCRKAGIRVMMITGDHPLTALAIASKIGLVPAESKERPVAFAAVIEGPQLDTLSDEALRKLLTPSRPGEPEPVFARMAPATSCASSPCSKKWGKSWP